MKVTLIDHTREPLALLIYTKNTRLQGGSSLRDIQLWPMDKKLEHLAYMRDTIKSSWEFVNYTFEITGVTRAFTHQLVRTRNGRYAQESMRTVDVSEAEIKKPDYIIAKEKEAAALPGNASFWAGRTWDDFASDAMGNYRWLLDADIPPQDARGILPTNVCTSIIAQFSLRTLHEMASVRLCTRTQGEYQDVFRAMKAAVVEVHPWAEDFIQVACVNTGVCIFPRYKKCPIQKYTYTGNDAKDKAVIACVKDAFESERHEAIPTAKDGRTM